MASVKTRTDLRTQVRVLTNIHSTARVSDTMINDVLEEVNQEVGDAFKWPQLRRVQEGVVADPDVDGASIPYPAAPSGSSVKFVERVLTTGPNGRYELQQLTDDEALRLDPDARGNPTHYQVSVVSWVGSTPERAIILHPKPKVPTTFTVQYSVTPPALSSDSSAPFAEPEYHSLWALLAAIRVLANRAGDERKIGLLGEQAATLAERMRRRYIMDHNFDNVKIGGAR